MAQIEVYQVKDGKKRYVPEHWMEHPELKRAFRKTPKTKASESDADNTSGSAAPATTNRTSTAASSGK